MIEMIKTFITKLLSKKSIMIVRYNLEHIGIDSKEFTETTMREGMNNGFGNAFNITYMPSYENAVTIVNKGKLLSDVLLRKNRIDAQMLLKELVCYESETL